MNTLFFVLSKLLWLVAAPDRLLFIVLLTGTLLLHSKRYAIGKFLISLVVLIMLLIAILPLGTWVVAPLENRFPPLPKILPKIEGIIVLSGAEVSLITASRSQPSLNSAAERLTSFVALAKRFPKAQLVQTGGSGSLDQQTFKSTQTAQAFFAESDLDLSRVIFETESRNTYENGLYSKKWVKPQAEGYWLLVTSAFHMPRAMGVFRRLGWSVIACPVDYRTEKKGPVRLGFNPAGGFGLLSLGVKEWLGLTAYYWTNKTYHLFPKPGK